MFGKSRTLFSDGYEILRRDRKLFLLPFGSIVLSLVLLAGCVYINRDFLFASEEETDAIGFISVIAFALWATGANVLSVLCKGAVTFGVRRIVNGGYASLGECFGAAWQRKRLLATLGLMSSADRTGRSSLIKIPILNGTVEKITGEKTHSMSWESMVPLLQPVIVFEEPSSFANAQGRAAELVQSRWGVYSSPRFNFQSVYLMFLVPIVIACIGTAFLTPHRWIEVVMVGVVLSITLISLVQASYSAVQAVLYEYAISGMWPTEFDELSLLEAFEASPEAA